MTSCKCELIGIYVRLLLNVVQDWVIPVKLGFFSPINLSRHSVTAERLKSNLNKKSLRSFVRHICHHSPLLSLTLTYGHFQPFDLDDDLLSDLLKRRFSVIWFQFWIKDFGIKLYGLTTFADFPLFSSGWSFPKVFPLFPRAGKVLASFLVNQRRRDPLHLCCPFPLISQQPEIGPRLELGAGD